MNERFKELAEQAYKDVNTNTPSFLVTKEMVDARFAELIVRECASVFWSEDCNTSDLALEEYNRNSKKIKEHFGVEE
jgi:hypothetical protein